MTLKGEVFKNSFPLVRQIAIPLLKLNILCTLRKEA